MSGHTETELNEMTSDISELQTVRQRVKRSALLRDALGADDSYQISSTAVVTAVCVVRRGVT